MVLLFSCTPEQSNPSGTDEPEGGKNKTVNVTGISLDRNSVTIKEGESVTLVATVTPSNADNKTVTWSSSSDAVATVDSGGKVTGIKAGSATITATAEDGGKKATCSISVEANLAPSVTIEAKNVSAISAVLAGKANLGSTVASDLKVGFQYSKSAGILPSNSTTIEAQDADASYNYTAVVIGLEPDTQYYFRSFVHQNNQYTYGETKPFTTKAMSTLLETWDASGVEAASATMNAKLDLTDIISESISYGFFWGTSESSLNSDFKCSEIKDNAISASLTNLSQATQYWYKAYVKLNDQSFYGEVKTFITDKLVTSISLDKTSLWLIIGDEATLSVTSVLPENAKDKTYTWSSSNSAIASVDNGGKVTARTKGNAVIKAMANDKSGVFASCSVYVIEEKVDMGIKLLNGKTLYWATRNLCESGFVNSPMDYGDYYAWGETATKSNFSWSNYKFGTSESGPFSKYNTDDSYGTVDNKIVLDPADDAAHVKLGGNWRMPTEIEWDALRSMCKWMLTTQNGVTGMLVTATNGNSIFLPAAGYPDKTYIYKAGIAGFYWSSSIYSSSSPRYARIEYFDSYYNIWGDSFRYNGHSVRPVTE